MCGGHEMLATAPMPCTPVPRRCGTQLLPHVHVDAVVDRDIGVGIETALGIDMGTQVDTDIGTGVIMHASAHIDMDMWIWIWVRTPRWISILVSTPEHRYIYAYPYGRGCAYG